MDKILKSRLLNFMRLFAFYKREVPGAHEGNQDGFRIAWLLRLWLLFAAACSLRGRLGTTRACAGHDLTGRETVSDSGDLDPCALALLRARDKDDEAVDLRNALAAPAGVGDSNVVLLADLNWLWFEGTPEAAATSSAVAAASASAASASTAAAESASSSTTISITHPISPILLQVPQWAVRLTLAN